jgi:hypothetical protein
MIGFFSEVKNFLKEGGKVYAGFSRSGNEELFIKHLNMSGLKIEKFEEKNSYDGMERFSKGDDFNYNCQVYTLVA